MTVSKCDCKACKKASPSANMKRLDTIRQGIVEEFDGASVEYENITARKCASDNYNGVEVMIYGTDIPVRPVIDAAAEWENLAIEHLTAGADDAALCVFVAFLPEQDHPAFVN